MNAKSSQDRIIALLRDALNGDASQIEELRQTSSAQLQAAGQALGGQLTFGRPTVLRVLREWRDSQLIATSDPCIWSTGTAATARASKAGFGSPDASEMSDAMSGLTVGDPIDLSATATEDPTELSLDYFEQWAEAHNDLWSDREAHVVLTIDPKKRKLIAAPVKLAVPSATADTSPASRTLPDPVVPLVEFAQVNRRSSLFPRHWGDVPFVPEVRHRWILENCRTDSHGNAERLIELRSKYLQLSIRARRFGPGE